MDAGHSFKGAALNNSGKGIAGTRYLDHMKGTILSSSRTFSGGRFFRKGSSTSAATSRENKPNGFVDRLQNSVKGRELSQPEHVYEKSNINGDGRNISCPVPVERHPTTIPKKSWHQLFTRSSPVFPQNNSNVISRPNGKAQSEIQSLSVSGHHSLIQFHDNPINFGLPVPFILPTSPFVPTSGTLFPVASGAMVPPIIDTSSELLPEESDIFEDPRYVPDPVSLLGPVSESFGHFQLDLCVGPTDLGLEKPRALKKIPVSSEVNKPSPIGSPMSRLRVSRGRHSSSNRFSGTSTVHEGHPPSEERTWQMWNSCPLGQDGLGLIGDPGSRLLCPELNRSNTEELHPLVHKTMPSLFTEEDKAVSSTRTPQNVVLGDCQNSGIFGTPAPTPCSGDDPWLPKKLFWPVSGGKDHFPLISPEETFQCSRQNKRIYRSPGGSESNLQFSPSSCWAKKEWSVQGSVEENGNAKISNARVGGFCSTPDVQLLRS